MKFTLFYALIAQTAKTMYIQRYPRVLSPRIHNLHVSTSHILPFVFHLRNMKKMQNKLNRIKKLKELKELKELNELNDIKTKKPHNLWKNEMKSETIESESSSVKNYYNNETSTNSGKSNKNSDEYYISWDDGEVEWDHKFLDKIEKYTLSYIQHPNAKLLYDKYFDGAYSKNSTFNKTSNKNSTKPDYKTPDYK